MMCNDYIPDGDLADMLADADDGFEDDADDASYEAADDEQA